MTLSEMIQENREEGFEEGREEGLEQGLAKGLSQGKEEKALETAKKMFNLKLSPQQIAECTGLSLEKVFALQKEVCVTV